MNPSCVFCVILYLNFAEVTWSVLGHWRSPHTVKGLLLCKQEFVMSASCDALPVMDAAHQQTHPH